MHRTRRGMNLTKGAMQKSLGRLKYPRDKIDMFYAFYEDARAIPSKKERDRVYIDLAEIAEGEENYALARNLYKLAGKRQEASEAQNKLLSSSFGGEERGKESALKKIVQVSSVIAMFVGAIFLAPNITGRVIDNLTKRNTNIVGMVLFILGLVTYYFLSKRK